MTLLVPLRDGMSPRYPRFGTLFLFYALMMVGRDFFAGMQCCVEAEAELGCRGSQSPGPGSLRKGCAHGLKIPPEATQMQGASFLFVSSPSLSYSHPPRTVAAAFLGKFRQTNTTFFFCLFCLFPSLSWHSSICRPDSRGKEPACSVPCCSSP